MPPSATANQTYSKFPEAWAITKGSEQTKVAILDSGFLPSPEVPETAFLRAPGWNHAENSNDIDEYGGQVQANSRHGSYIIQILNGIGAYNYWGARRAGRAAMWRPYHDAGTAAAGQIDTATAHAMVDAANWGAHVINQSLQISEINNHKITDAIHYAFDRDVVNVCAAANNGVDARGDSAYFVAGNWDYVCGVAATQSGTDTLHSYSNFYVHVAAPSPNEASVVDFLQGNPYGSSVTTLSGTSGATPLVSGLAALCHARNRRATNRQIYQAIFATCRSIGQNITYGHIVADAAVSYMDNFTSVDSGAPASTFTDISGHANETAIRTLEWLGVLRRIATSGAAFNPNTNLTRAHYALAMEHVAGRFNIPLRRVVTLMYTDMDYDPTGWAAARLNYDYVLVGPAPGFGDTFGPTGTVERETAILELANIIEVSTGTRLTATGSNYYSDTNHEDVNAFVEAGILPGGGTFNPTSATTRGEFAQWVRNAYQWYRWSRPLVPENALPTYKFQLTVTDPAGRSATDVVAVKPPPQIDISGSAATEADTANVGEWFIRGNPYNLAAYPEEPNGSNTIYVEWQMDGVDFDPGTAAFYVAGYELERDGQVFTVPLGPGDVVASSYSDMGRTPSTTYSYRVRAIYWDDSTSPWTGPVQATTEGSADTPVTGNAASETDTANAGSVSVDAAVAGSTGSEADVANAGSVHQILSVQGSSATETASASAGTHAVASSHQGAVATETSSANVGSTTTTINLVGAVVAETDSALLGAVFTGILLAGGSTSETDTPHAGAVQPPLEPVVFALSDPNTVSPEAPRTLHYRARVSSGTGSITVKVFEGSTEVQSFTEPLTATWTTFSNELASPATAVISDYNETQVRIVGVGPQGAELQVSWLQLEVPGTPGEEIDVFGNNAPETDTANAGAITVHATGTGAQVISTSVAYAGSISVTTQGAAVAETDTALAGTTTTTTSVTGAFVTETDSAYAGALTGAAAIAGQQAVETDTAVAGAHTTTVLAAGTQIVETDTAFAGAVFTATVVQGQQVAEADIAYTGTIDVVVNLGGAQATETDTAVLGTVTTAATGAGAQVATTSAAHAGTASITFTGTAVAETDVAFAGTGALSSAGVVATEVDSALAGATTTHALIAGSSRAETDTARPGSTPGSFVIVGEQVTETDAAAVGATTTLAEVLGAQATETDTATAGTTFTAIAIAGAQATEASLAQAGATTVVALLVGAQVAETDTAHLGSARKDAVDEGSWIQELSIAHPGSVTGTADLAGAAATETSVAYSGSVHVTETGAGQQAIETDTALTGTTFTVVLATGSTTAETDVALSGQVSVAFTGSTTTETDQAVAGAPSVALSVTGTQAIELDTAQAGGFAVVITGAPATVTETAHAGQVAAVLVGAAAIEVSTASAGAVTGAFVVLGASVTETDTATQGVASAQPEGAGAQVVEWQTAHAGAIAVVSTGSTVAEVDLAASGVVFHGVVAAGSVATESDILQTGSVSVAIGVTGTQATEASTAYAGAIAAVLVGGSTSESVQAHAGAVSTTAPASQATETDTAHLGSLSVVVDIPGSSVVETDFAPAGGTTAGHIITGTGVIEVDTEFAGIVALALQGVQGTETDLAFAQFPGFDGDLIDAIYVIITPPQPPTTVILRAEDEGHVIFTDEAPRAVLRAEDEGHVVLTTQDTTTVTRDGDDPEVIEYGIPV